jgi:hypothetical protein
MESFREIYMSKNAENYIRTFTEGDNIITLYGVRNNILGGFNQQSTQFENFSNVLPDNMQINGFGFIYNENTYEDFDNLIDHQMDKLKNYSQVSDTLFCFIVKDMKYLDDFESLNYEKCVIKNFEDSANENEAIVKLDLTLNKFTTNFLLLNADIKLEFYDEKNFPSEKLKDPNGIKISYKNYRNEINEIFSNNNFISYLENEKNLIEKLKNFEDNDVKKLNDIMKKLEVNSNIYDNVNF